MFSLSLTRNVCVCLSFPWFVLLTCESCVLPSLRLPTSESCISIFLFLITPPEALGQKTSFSEVYFYYTVVLYCHLLYGTDMLENSFQINVTLSS